MVLRSVIIFGIILFSCTLSANGQYTSNLKPIINSDHTLAQLKGRIPPAEYDTFVKLAGLATKALEYQQAGKDELAKESYEQYLSLLRAHLSLVFAITDSDYYSDYWNIHLGFINHITTCAMLLNIIGESHWDDLAYNCALLSKNLFLDSYVRLKSAVFDSTDEEIISLWNACEEFRYAYNTNMTGVKILEADSAFIATKEAVMNDSSHLSGEDVREIENFKLQLDTMRIESLSTGELLSRSLCATDNMKNDFGALWADVHKSLSQGEAAIEFVSYYNPSKPDEIKYSAILLRYDSERPQIISSFSELQLTVALLKNESSFFTSLYDLIWQPIEKHLEGINEIYLSTTGMIDRVPFHAVMHKGEYLSQKYKINNVLSTKEIIKLKRDKARPDKYEAVFFGGIDYGIVQKNTDDTTDKLTRAQGVDYLYQSKIEVANSAKLLREEGWVASVFTDEYASENQVKECLAKSTPYLLHIATHGFYFPHKTAGQFTPKTSDFRKSNLPLFEYNDDPLMRCGLLLAGANRVWGEKKYVDLESDGILTGMEISLLNLRKTELVVISACHTGIGDVDYFEGTFGVLRAFKMAGVHKLIAALWEIPDKESAEFMQEFYSFLRVSQNITDAFRSAQGYMRQKYPAHPKK